MQILTDNIAYLWLLPVSIFIVIQLLLHAGWTAIAPIKGLFTGPGSTKEKVAVIRPEMTCNHQRVNNNVIM